jgi:hypothetical protein
VHHGFVEGVALPLKLGPISRQLEVMAQTMARVAPLDAQHLTEAQHLLHSIDADALRAKLQPGREKGRMPWLVAMPLGTLSGATNSGRPPPDLCIVGCDASSIPPDRHGSARYYVLNTGYAALYYGNDAHAILESESRLCFEDEDVYLFPDKRDVPIDGTLLNARMEVESLRLLQTWLRGNSQSLQGTALTSSPTPQSPAVPTLVLRDGPLTLWTLQNESDAVQDALLRGFLASLDSLRLMSIPVAGYISYTDSRDVANSLRVWLCDGQLNECEKCQHAQRDLCLALASVRDRDLFGFLHPGQRSELFGSSSQILERYGQQRVDFFYLNVGNEVARVEIPQWVHRDPVSLSLLHCGIVDQCQRSMGFPPYPPALQEAHEQAVITTTERRLVAEMVEQTMGQHGQKWTRSAKDDSKRRRGV